MHTQAPIGSQFGAKTTASEVLASLTLQGKLAIVTGGYSGLGLETTRALSAAGARVIVAGKRPAEARKVLAGIAPVEVEELDLATPESIHRFAERTLSRNRHVDILINNAGIMACPEERLGDGWESQFATNHLGHYFLTNLLWPLLTGGARVISVSSAGHHLSGIRWDDLHFNHGYDKWTAYGQSKTANILFAVHLDALGKDANVRAFSLHPGKIFTPLQRHLTQEEMHQAGWIDAEGRPADPTFKTPEQGAATQVWAAVSRQLEGMGGLYCEDCEIAPMTQSEPFVGVRDYAVDSRQAEKLWRLSAELTGIDRITPAPVSN